MLRRFIRKILDKTGYMFIQIPKGGLYRDLDPAFLKIYDQCRPYTMTSIERMYALYKAIEYIETHNIPGDIVECGVWRGGSSMLSALSLMAFNSTRRKIYLYDTFEGMSAPTEKDIEAGGEPATALMENDKMRTRLIADIDLVKTNMSKTGYPNESLFFIKGKVEDTIPQTVPPAIALLRLDTDWYESTYHELTHLYPLLSVHAPLIIDDYGAWEGARKAVDQYFSEHNTKIFLTRIDNTGRIGLKLT